MTAYLTEFIVGLLAMAALFVWVGKNDPMVNDVTIGKRFTNGDIATKKKAAFLRPTPTAYAVARSATKNRRGARQGG